MSSKLSISLSCSCLEAAEKLVGAESAAQVASVLEVPLGQLLFILYDANIESRYRSFQIPKKRGGFRDIRSPIGSTSILQRKLKPILEELYRVKTCVHGFVPQRSVVTNAHEHVRKKYVLNIDLENFYGHINFGRVRGIFIAPPFRMSPKAASVLAQLCTVDNQLPQGAPTSPVLSNLVATNLDRRMMHLAKRSELRYTRYADDLTFSTTKSNFPEAVACYEGNNPITGHVKLGSLLTQEVDAAGFQINFSKVRLQIRGIRQEATGLTVNEFPNVPRKFVRRIRAQIHAWEKYGLKNAAKEYCKQNSLKLEESHCISYFKNVIYGELAYLKMVRGATDSIYIKLCLAVAEQDSEAPKSIKRLRVMHEQFDVFICHASEDKDSVGRPIADACETKGIKAFLDVNYIQWGDSLTEKINHALGQSKFVVAILSPHSIEKKWPSKEINSSLAREIDGKQKILPLMVGNPNMDLFPLLQDKLYLTWDGDADLLADKLHHMIYE